MVQKSAQMEIDLDQTAALLCQQMQEAADRDAAMCQLQAQLAWERDQRIMAMAAIFPLNAQLQLKNHELGRAADMNIRLKVCLMLTCTAASGWLLCIIGYVQHVPAIKIMLFALRVGHNNDSMSPSWAYAHCT